jgi:hypothetical protein
MAEKKAAETAVGDCAEQKRLNEAREAGVPWKRWGPYLSERQWGTVLEDYSADGNAWDYFSHDQSRSRAYRWGEDGLAGISDDQQRLCFALALWNERDPILEEAAVTDWRLAADYYFFRNAGLGVQYKFNRYSYDRGVLVSELGGEVTFQGVQVYLSFRF